jgi:hypothetical protein
MKTPDSPLDFKLKKMHALNKHVAMPIKTMSTPRYRHKAPRRSFHHVRRKGACSRSCLAEASRIRSSLNMVSQATVVAIRKAAIHHRAILHKAAMADTHSQVTADIHPKADMEVILRKVTADTHLRDMLRSHRRRADLVPQVVRRLDLVGV